MFDAATRSVSPQPAASSVGETAATVDVDIFGPAILRAERRLRILERLTDIGMTLTEALQRRVLADEQATADAAANGHSVDDSAKSPVSKSSRSDPADAFAKLSRAVRLTVHLETKADEALRALQSGQFQADEARRAESRRPDATGAERRAREARGKTLDRVSTVIQAEALTESEFCDLMEAVEERLNQDWAYINLQDRPLRETVERLCKDLDLSPDWTHWAGDGWIDEGPPKRPPWSIFNTPSRKRFHPGDDPDSPDRLE